MWRALFLALGATLIVLGIECFMVDQVEVNQFGQPAVQASAFSLTPARPASFITRFRRTGSWTYEPNDWMPWSLMAVGTVVLIYTASSKTRGSDD